MKKGKINYLNFEVDKLTRSIENVITGDSFPTEISYLTNQEVKSITKKSGWKFDWKKELNYNDREVFKLTIQGNLTVIQAIMSLRIEDDHVYMPLIESAPFNRGKDKVYFGAPGNLVAYACRFAFQKGFDGFVSFHSKTKLIEHYEKSLGASHFGGHLMILNSTASNKLVDKYFKS
ncbi:MAG: hypothetical protein LH615_01100 [Ferruginibacter sp.]|nr:hypothetical protein [Ferruginibacter sp.]